MLIAGIIIAVLGIALFPQKEILGGIVFLLVGGLLIFLGYRKRSQEKGSMKPLSPEQINKLAEWPEEYNGRTIAYQYTEVQLYRPPKYQKRLPFITPGTELTIQREPKNQYDCNAVKFTYKGELVGYVHKNRMQDMLNEWITAGRPVIARFINYPSKEAAYINIAFYRDLAKKKDTK